MTDHHTDPERAAASILETAATWPGVTTRIKPRGSTAILLGGVELGHVHLDRRTLDMPVGERRAQILREGRANEWFSDWVSKPITGDTDAADGLALLRESYDSQRTRSAPLTPARTRRHTNPEEEPLMATTTETNDRTAHLLKRLKAGDDAFNERDFAAMDAVHHPDMTAHVMGSAEPIHGRAAHAEMIKRMFRIFPDVHVENDPYPVGFGDGDWITVVTRATGTFTGEMVLPDGNVITPTSKAFDLDFATTARWDGDLLIEEFVLWDSALQAQQIGLA